MRTLLPTAFCLSQSRGLVSSQDFEEGGGGVRKSHLAAVRRPERAVVGQSFDGDGGKTPVLQLLADAHARDKRETDLELDEALDGLDGRELQRDVERRVMLREDVYNFLPRRRFDVVRDEGFLS